MTAPDNTIKPLLQDDELSSKYSDIEHDNDNDDSPQAKTMKSSEAQTPRKLVALYNAIFFFAMLAHELALEAVSSKFPDLESLASSVTLFQFGFCFILPFVISRGKVCRTFPTSFQQVLPYVRLSFLVFGATGLATQSLKYVSYPTKVVFKSAKLIPTMVVSTLVYRNKKFTPLEYFAAFLICLGAAGYSYNGGGGGGGSSGSGSGSDNDTSYYGIGLLIISIMCDAIVPNFQQQLMASPTANNSNSTLPKVHGQGISGSGLSADAVMINTNTVGFAMILVGMLISGSLKDAVSTAVLDPRLLVYLVSVGLGLSTAVLAYTKLIKASGPVMAVAVATLRKVVTMLLSYIIFPKPILSIHVFSGLLVLAGVVISTFCRRGRR